MKKQIITYIFVGSMLASTILCGTAFADPATEPSTMDRQQRMEMKDDKRLVMMTANLDLSELQQQQIRAIHEQERVGLEETRKQRHTGREKMRLLLESDTFDEAAIRSLAASQASLEVEMLVSRARVKHQVFQLLNPEQQALSKKIQPLLQGQDNRRPKMKRF